MRDRPAIVGISDPLVIGGARRLSPSVALLFLLAVGVLYTVSGGMLWLVGYNYEGITGSAVTKIHPGSYLVFLAFLLALLENGDPIGAALDAFKRRPACLLLFLAAVVSGVVVYLPFWNKVGLGRVRMKKSRRIAWLDGHNALGMLTLLWALIVGATGSINTLADLLLDAWRNDQLAQMLAPYQGKPPVTATASVDGAVATARRAAPDMTPSFVAFPGTRFSSPHHYTVFMRGDGILTTRMLRPVLIDAATGALTDSRELPWYLKLLLGSQPLHFGDFGGMPLKLFWAAFDILTIVVLGSGLYLWLSRGKKRRVVA